MRTSLEAEVSWATEYIGLEVGDMTAEGDLRCNEGMRRRVTRERSGMVLESKHFDDGQWWVRPCPGQMALPFNSLKAGDTVWVGQPRPYHLLECQVISNLLARIESEDPETNTLPESLKSFAGKDLRLETNDLQGIKIIPDEACYAVLEYYALDARAYAGQDTAKTNYRMTGRAGMRVFRFLASYGP